jgi:PAS domain S-box-containing protein
MTSVFKGRYLQFLVIFAYIYAIIFLVSWFLGEYKTANPIAVAIVLGMLSATLFYYLLGFRLANKHLGRQTAYTIGVTLLSVPILIAATMHGGYESPHNIAYVILIFASAIIAPGVPLVLVWIQILGYALALAGYMPTLGNVWYGAAVIAACIAAGVGGWLAFRRYYKSEDPEIEELHHLLKSQQLQSEAVIGAISDGVAIVDRNGITVHANQQFLDMIYLKREELIGKHTSEVVTLRIRIITSSTGTPRLGQNIAHVFKTGEPITIDYLTAEYTDGRGTFDFSISISPLRSDSGEITAVMIMARDITNLMRLQRMKDALLSTASHELRTPITVIAGYADLLLGKGDGELTEKQRHYIERTKETTTHLTEMINDMLDMSRLESGQQDDDPVATNIQDILESTTAKLLSQFAAKNISLHIDASSTRVYADTNRLKQVLLHILSNGLKFTPDDGHITISSRMIDNMCEVSISDTGPGVPEEHLEDIFDKFTKLDDTGAITGTGLGLAIAKNIVDNWRGTIGVENIPKGGARFYFTVPLANDKDNEKQEEEKNEDSNH